MDRDLEARWLNAERQIAEVAKRRRDMHRQAKINRLAFWTVWFCLFSGLGWCIGHPRDVGAFFGRIEAGFHEGAR